MTHTVFTVVRRAMLAAVFLMVVTAFTAWLAFGAIHTQASTDRYVFLVRGIVTEVNHSANTVRLYATHTSPLAGDDLAGTPVDYNVSPAEFYKWDDGVKKRVTFTKSAQVGDEVVMRGAAKENGNYNVAWLVVNDRDFEVVGRVKEHNKTLKRIKVLVGNSTYKQSYYAGKEIFIHYDNNDSFNSLGKSIEPEELPADNQLVKIKGTVEGVHWDASHVWDNYGT